MRVQVFSNASDAHQAQFIGKTVIVIDVVRTSTTIVAALEAGAASVIPVETIMEAKQQLKDGDLLGGERFCKRIAGFHYGNAPQEYVNAPLTNKRLILTTTDGTRAILRSIKAATLYVGGLVNATACVEAAIRTNRDLVLLCAGSQDQFTIEDGYCAGLMISRLRERISEDLLEINDLGYAMLSLYEHMKHNTSQLIHIGLSSKRLTSLGLSEDILPCLAIDQTSIVPIYDAGKIKRASLRLT